MPRNKKLIHRATSDIEDEEVEEIEQVGEQPLKKDTVTKSTNDPITQQILEERKKFLKEVLLKRKNILKQNKREECLNKVS